MRANGVEAAIARYRDAGTKSDAAQSELRSNGERVLGGFTVQKWTFSHLRICRTPLLRSGRNFMEDAECAE